jgi:PhoH-like ATPase
MHKTYVIDTNVLLSDPNALQSFEDNSLIVPLAVLEELDRHKNRQDDVGACARQVNRNLDKLREKGNLLDGVQTSGGGTLRIASIDPKTVELLPPELEGAKVDNLIIAFMLQQRAANTQSILVSKDINVRIKCDALGIKCEDYKKMRVADDPKKFYRGVVVHEVSKEFINQFYADGGIEPDPSWELFPNQIVVLKSVLGSQTQASAIARFVSVEENDRWLRPTTKIETSFGLKPRNKEQSFSLDLLYDPNIKLVTLVGPSGTGKTLLAIAAGLEQNVHIGDKKLARYSRLVVTRPVQPVGRDIGFLPGSLYEKMEPWLAPVRDNLAFLMSSGGKKKPQLKGSDASGQRIDPYMSLMIEKGVIEIEAISYIRGRSIPDSYIVIDEAQNLTIHELKTIITRVGENTKIILTGDIEQIDNVNVDVFSNGLSYAIEKFKNTPIAAHVTLLKGERSELATIAAQLL